ncbi:MAG: heparinase II/III family protein [bacterium]
MRKSLAAIALTAALSVLNSPFAFGGKIVSDEEIDIAHRNLEEYPEAKEIVENLRKSLEPWMECSLDDLWRMVPPPEVPRAFNTSVEGCPCHGRELYKYGNYAWKLDPWKNPWRLTCPIGGAEYPSNDFAAFLATGMRDRSLITGPYGDNGWGVLLPGETKKRWFVAYYCHWFWMSHLIPAVHNLGRAYCVTSDEEYGLRCAALLDRIADFYPGMDYNKQSRYALEFYSSYTGKIVNRIWETAVLSKFAEAYDAIQKSLPSMIYTVTGSRDPIANPGRQESIVRNGPDIDRNIRENLLRLGLDGVLDGKTVRGNFGMHQRAAVHLALALNEPETIQKVVRYVVNGNETLPEDSLSYAFDNLFFREGVGFESAPGYCYTWTDNVLTLSRLLSQLDVDLYSNHHLPKIAGAPGRMIIQNMFSPTIGDSGNAVTSIVRLGPQHAADIWDRYHRACEARDLLASKKHGAAWFSSYESLFRLPPEQETLEDADKSQPSRLRSDLFHDYGLAILRDRAEPCDVAATVYFGQAAGHAHQDRLNLELFAWGKKIIPDLGYPQFASEDKQTFAWDRHTASHVVVEVDEHRQDTKDRGRLHLFGVTEDDFLSYVEASAEDCYPNRVETYRRGVAMVGEGPSAYILDIFWVRGGTIHDYSIHAFDAPLKEMAGLELLKQPAGTLAGRDIPFGYLYDNPDLEDPNKTRSFGSYLGSGYSYLTDVRRGSPNRPFRLTWKDNDVGLQMTFLGDGLSDVALSRGRPPRREANPLELDFVRLREKRTEKRMTVFVTLIHPFKEKPFVRGGDVFFRDEKGHVKVTVAHCDGEDVIDVSPGAWCRVDRFSNGKRNAWSVASDGGEPEPWRVTWWDAKTNRVAVSKQGTNPLGKPQAGDTVIFRSDDRAASYTITSVEEEPERWWIGLGDDLPIIGRIRVDEVQADEGLIRSTWSLTLAAGKRYQGACLVSEDLQNVFRISRAKGNELWVKEPSRLPNIQPGQTMLIGDFGPGDEIVVCRGTIEQD